MSSLAPILASWTTKYKNPFSELYISALLFIVDNYNTYGYVYIQVPRLAAVGAVYSSGAGGIIRGSLARPLPFPPFYTYI